MTKQNQPKGRDARTVYVILMKISRQYLFSVNVKKLLLRHVVAYYKLAIVNNPTVQSCDHVVNLVYKKKKPLSKNQQKLVVTLTKVGSLVSLLQCLPLNSAVLPRVEVARNV